MLTRPVHLAPIQLPLIKLVKLIKTVAHTSKSFGGITHEVSQLELSPPGENVMTP